MDFEREAAVVGDATTETEESDTRSFNIWNVNDKAWWRSPLQGMTTRREDAHAFSREQAEDITVRLFPPGHLKMVPCERAPVPGDPAPETEPYPYEGRGMIRPGSQAERRRDGLVKKVVEAEDEAQRRGYLGCLKRFDRRLSGLAFIAMQSPTTGSDLRWL